MAKVGGAAYGITLDATSDDNLIKGNALDRFTTNVSDGGGSSNCWLGNHFVTGMVPTTGCP
jgi:hypothetical protein